MKKAFGDYKLLTKGSRTRGHLWQGPDHLLYVETAGFLTEFTESYKRIDFKNIQAITYAKTRTGIWITVFNLLLLLFFGWLTIEAIMESSPGALFLGAFAMLTLVALIVHLSRGPTCVCKLQTAVQFLHLKPADRLHKAARFVANMEPLCRAHQDGQVMTPAPLVATAVQPLPTDHGIKLPWAGSKLVTWTMTLLVISGALNIADVFIQNMLFFSINCLLSIATYVLVISTLVRTTRFQIPAALKGALWGAAGNFILSIATGYGLVIWASMSASSNIFLNRQQDFVGDPNYAIYKFISDADFDKLGWIAWLLVSIGGIAIFTGLLGLPSALRPGAAMPVAQIASTPPPMQNNQP